MTTEIVPFNFGAIPANLKKTELSAATLALAGSGASQGKRISIEGGVFRMIAGGKEVAKRTQRDMDIVLVRTAPANNRVFYDPSIPYVRGQAVPPVCTSVDGIKPDARIKEPQSVTCASCPQNIAGSGTGDSRACRFQRRIAVVLGGDLSGDVYQIVLPATSLFGKGTGTNNLPLEAYARMLAVNNVSIDRMVTKMEFDTDSSTPKLTFSPVRHLDAREIALVEQQGETEEACAAVGEIAATYQALPAPVDAPVVVEPVKPKAVIKAKAIAKPVPVVAVVADDEPETGAEPVVVKAEPNDRDARIKNALAAWAD